MGLKRIMGQDIISPPKTAKNRELTEIIMEINDLREADPGWGVSADVLKSAWAFTFSQGWRYRR
jgi:hypothetical protein